MADFGDDKFGKSFDRPHFVGRRVDLWGRGIPAQPGDDPATTIRAYLCAGRTITTRLLAEKAVLLLTPELRLGEVVWGGEEINAATQSGRRGSQRE